MTSDSIADMLTRIRNANQAHHRTVEIPVSKMKVEIARVLTEEGFVDGYEVSGEAPMQVLTVTLKPGSPRGRALSGLRRISRPGIARLRAQIRDPSRSRRTGCGDHLDLARIDDRSRRAARRTGRRSRRVRVVGRS